MAYLLEMDSLSASYDTGIVLEDINFCVDENDFIGVIGPNGGGKTTLLKVILGLIKPVSGKIIFNNDLLDGNSIGYLAADIDRGCKLSGYSHGCHSFGDDDQEKDPFQDVGLG